MLHFIGVFIKKKLKLNKIKNNIENKEAYDFHQKNITINNKNNNNNNKQG